MRYAIFSDIHANLEALEAVLAKIDELTQDEPIEQIWFLGDLVGYGPNPNECILKLRERTDVIIAGNHDWAAVGKIDLEDFSSAARISAEWTAEQLTEAHREFLTNLPERIQIGECTLVHGSPYGPLWEYLTSEVLAERSFHYFSSRYCLVGHTHVPVIFQQPDAFSNAPTLPLHSDEPVTTFPKSNGVEHRKDESEVETEEMVVVQSPIQQSTLLATVPGTLESAFKEPVSDNQIGVEDEESTIREDELKQFSDEKSAVGEDSTEVTEVSEDRTNHLASPANKEIPATEFDEAQKQDATTLEERDAVPADVTSETEKPDSNPLKVSDEELQNAIVPHQIEEVSSVEENSNTSESSHAAIVEMEINESLDTPVNEANEREDGVHASGETDHEIIVADTDDQLSSEIEELLTLLGLSQSMMQVTNEMITPPEGLWRASDGYRAIINPGGVGQPRDGDPRAAFIVYDTEHGFEFYRVPYSLEKTQEKIIQAGLPQYLAVRLAYGR